MEVIRVVKFKNVKKILDENKIILVAHKDGAQRGDEQDFTILHALFKVVDKYVEVVYDELFILLGVNRENLIGQKKRVVVNL